MYIHTHAHMRTRVITHKTPFIASQKHKNYYAKQKQNHFKPF